MSFICMIWLVRLQDAVRHRRAVNEGTLNSAASQLSEYQYTAGTYLYRALQLTVPAASTDGPSSCADVVSLSGCVSTPTRLRL